MNYEVEANKEMGWYHADLSDGKNPFGAAPPPCSKDLKGIEVIYHICPKQLWLKAEQEELPYFPATFHKDGGFTRASTNKEVIIDMANQVYETIKTEEWICLELNLKVLLQMGIVVLPQDQDRSISQEEKNEEDIQFLKVYAGITTTIEGVVEKIYSMDRTNRGTFVGMVEQESIEGHSTEKTILTKSGFDEMGLEDMFRAQRADALPQSPQKDGKKKKKKSIVKGFGKMLK